MARSKTTASATDRAPERSVQLTQVAEWNDGKLLPHEDTLAAEEPLEIRIANSAGVTPLSVTMRTPGHDEELAAGFLWTEGIVENPVQIASLNSYVTSAGGKSNGVGAVLRNCDFDPGQLQRNFFAASSCGICGKASIDAIRQRGLRAPDPDFRFDPDLLCALPDRLREAQTVFSQTGEVWLFSLRASSGLH